MRVLFFTKYTRKGASSRLRTYQYIDFLEANGIQCYLSPFFDDEYLSEVYSSKTHNKVKALESFVKRLVKLFSVRKYDLVVIEKELFPYFPALPERILRWTGTKYIVDYDDAIWHNYDVSQNPIIRFFLRNKITWVMRSSYQVIAGNKYIKEKAIKSGAKKIQIIPTVVDLEKYKVRQYNLEKEEFVIGWIGSPITAKYLPFLKPLIENLSNEFRIRLKLIGATHSIGLSEIEEMIPWEEAREVEFIRSFDVGIMPLEDNIWERGKCGYKLIQYMGCGVPVIGTPIGVNKELIRPKWNGFQASTPDEWEQALRYLILNRAEGVAMGINGRKLVEENYSLQVYRSNWLDNLLQKS